MARCLTGACQLDDVRIAEVQPQRDRKTLRDYSLPIHRSIPKFLD
jgi:hypothetical protein